MNYDEIPKQIKCRMCKTVQDADHKYCKECGVSFKEKAQCTPDKSILDRWIEAEKTCIKRDGWVNPFSLPVTSCISTSSEAAQKMSERFTNERPRSETISYYIDIAACLRNA